MTQAEAHKIAEMQKEGAGYRRIATALGMPINTVKSYCQRHPVVQTEVASNNCKHCGADLGESAGKRKKQFCSDKCRMAWWSQHRYMVQRKATRQAVCAYCGNSFSVYGRPNQKFCSLECYQKNRGQVAK